MGKLPLSQELFGVRFAKIAVDFISGFRTTDRGNTCMMVVQDYYTKYVQVYPMPNHTAITSATSLFENVLKVLNPTRDLPFAGLSHGCISYASSRPQQAL